MVGRKGASNTESPNKEENKTHEESRHERIRFGTTSRRNEQTLQDKSVPFWKKISEKKKIKKILGRARPNCGLCVSFTTDFNIRS